MLETVVVLRSSPSVESPRARCWASPTATGVANRESKGFSDPCPTDLFPVTETLGSVGRGTRLQDWISDGDRAVGPVALQGLASRAAHQLEPAAQPESRPLFSLVFSFESAAQPELCPLFSLVSVWAGPLGTSFSFLQLGVDGERTFFKLGGPAVSSWMLPCPLALDARPSSASLDLVRDGGVPSEVAPSGLLLAGPACGDGCATAELLEQPVLQEGVADSTGLAAVAKRRSHRLARRSGLSAMDLAVARKAALRAGPPTSAGGTGDLGVGSRGRLPEAEVRARQKIMGKSAMFGIKLNEADASNFLEFARTSVHAC